MSLTSGGVKTPLPLRQWILHLERARLAAKKARRTEKRLRANDRQRLEQADRLLAEVIEGADVVAQANTGDLWRGRSIFLLVSLSPEDFNRLAEYGAELEDAENSHDAEPGADREPSIGVDAPEFDPCDEGEQKAYSATADRPIIEAARARYAPRPEPERAGALTYATVDPETGRAGMWVLHRRTAR